MINEKAILTLRTIYDLLLPTNINWLLFGSTSLIIRGIKVIPNLDIDILTDKENIYKIDNLLKGYRNKPLEYCHNAMYKSYYSTYTINGVNIDLVANFRCRRRHKHWSKRVPIDKYDIVDFEGMRLHLLPLEQELKEYYETERMEKYNKIKEYLIK